MRDTPVLIGEQDTAISRNPCCSASYSPPLHMSRALQLQEDAVFIQLCTLANGMHAFLQTPSPSPPTVAATRVPFQLWPFSGDCKRQLRWRDVR